MIVSSPRRGGLAAFLTADSLSLPYTYVQGNQVLATCTPELRAVSASLQAGTPPEALLQNFRIATSECARLPSPPRALASD
jgi:hypothetical protein